MLAQEVPETYPHAPACSGKPCSYYRCGTELRVAASNRLGRFRRISKNEFAWFQRSPGAGRRYLTRTFYDWLRELVAVAKMIVSVVNWRGRIEVQRRKNLDAFALGDELVMFEALAALALGGVAGK